MKQKMDWNKNEIENALKGLILTFEIKNEKLPHRSINNENIFKEFDKKYKNMFSSVSELFYANKNGIESLYCKICGKRKKSHKHNFCSIECRDKNPNRYEKFKKTCLEKYGYENPSLNKEIVKKTKIKRQKTMKSKYGVQYALQNKNFVDKKLKTTYNRYRVFSSFSLKTTREKIKQTLIKKYGVDNPQKNKQINKKTRKTFIKNNGVFSIIQLPGVLDKIKQNNLKKYGVDNVRKVSNIISKIQQNRYKSMKKNNSFSKSKQEDIIYKLLKQKFINVERQHKTNLYPFSCDFYIKDIDTYIEYNGFWTHGNEAFDSKNEKHLQILLQWKNESNKINKRGKSKYDIMNNAIIIWTKKDPNKRKIAKDNKLNYLEFFNINQFYKWYNKLNF